MSQSIVFLLAFAGCVLAASIDSNSRILSSKTSAERIQEYGYPAETHLVETSDGFVLNLYRIPYSPKLNNQTEQKPVVFMQHGFLSSSDSFLLNGPDNAIAYLFADAGYDVWLGNSRGNRYSRKNNKMWEIHPKFWDFSWHEIGNIDMPASIDYILQVTGENRLHFVGHSQGTTAFFVMTSTRPAYNNKIKTAHALAPIAFLGNSKDGMLAVMSVLLGQPGFTGTSGENQEFLVSNPLIQGIVGAACGSNSPLNEACQSLYLLMDGGSEANINKTLLPQFYETHPAGASMNEVIHNAQLRRSKKFRQYDHGFLGNLLNYGKTSPPDYPLQQITSKLFLYYGLADETANKEDTLLLSNYLPNVQLLYEVPNPTWGHTDFVFAMQVKEVINDPIIARCNAYENI